MLPPSKKEFTKGQINQINKAFLEDWLSNQQEKRLKEYFLQHWNSNGDQFSIKDIWFRSFTEHAGT